MKCQKHISGYTLTELMIVVTIIGLLAGMAVPAYKDYISTTASSTAQQNAETLRAFQEAYRVETDTYLVGVHPAGAANSILTTSLHWTPGDKDVFTYNVTPGTSGSIADSLTITVTCDICPAPIIIGN